MAINVVCPGCRSRFAVSEKFAGKTGPCPKCKQPIVIPTPAAKDVVVHEPEPAQPTAPGAAPVTIPFRRVETRVSGLTWTLVVAGAVVTMVVAWATGRAWSPATPPDWILAVGGFLVAIPCVALGYAAIRDRELEAYQGRSLALRVLICSAVYAALWLAKGVLPAESTAEMWQWLYLGPLFAFPGVLAAYAAFDFDWGPASVHFSFYVIVTAFLRWLAGVPPL
jgi:hypothetical protein